MRSSITADDGLLAEPHDTMERSAEKKNVEETLKRLIADKTRVRIRNFSGRLRCEGDLAKLRADIRKRREGKPKEPSK